MKIKFNEEVMYCADGFVDRVIDFFVKPGVYDFIEETIYTYPCVKLRYKDFRKDIYHDDNMIFNHGNSDFIDVSNTKGVWFDFCDLDVLIEEGVVEIIK